jgi:hypothetical protein
MKTINRPEVKATMRIIWAGDWIHETKGIIESDMTDRKKIAAIKKVLKSFEE